MAVLGDRLFVTFLGRGAESPARSRTALRLWITFELAPKRPENAPFLPFRKAKSALALAPKGVTPQNVKMGMTKCALF